MSKKFMRRTLLAFAAVPVLALSSQANAADAPLKVGFVYVSPIGEAGWTWQQDLGRREMEKNLGDKVKTQYVEDVPEGADAERVIRDLAQQGNKLIFTTSFGYMNPTIKVAKQFPDVKFVHSTGYKTAPNVATTNARFYEARYLAGIIAGKMTKTNVAGYVGAFPIPEVLQGMNAFTRGMRSVNPKAEVRVIWVNSWFDPGKERDAALALIGQGADVVTHHTDSTATVQVAEEKGKYAVAYHSDMSKFGPHAQLAAVTHHWGKYFTKEAQDVLNGTWKADSTWGGLKEGMAALDAVNPAVPDDVKKLVEEKKAEIIAGKLTPFDGPVVTNEGKTILASGSMDDKGLNQMNYYVEGIAGKLPSK
ncbi:BMP family ABC transporter substrate-binding protein [Eoetvoesiella caeni]|uniref:Simple sugar transport system substrate-binding protein n=1 Tax=Eoetvoesiella caeni TaxID=645616 RepID=A0A366HC15_9BURK|nr:BMP family ABC transporter substrate-binding protein [Eoetvoesiella caeni]MCI2809120.1 BMP family ABC transporter substrate-binding protein [Eoetvoesiella caeni]NYT55379.1 BMP family ABC transporter substrate-binding protein [Eoetvoesiella caeni]RBP39930.1 simple sugar transport system substrate-binding protein [Eoetvoesiella caeni]